MTTTPDILRAIEAHGKATYPEECCGFLLGHALPEGNTVTALYPIDNAQGDNRERRFLMRPDDYRQADQAARQQQVDVVGTYHSHPDHPAKPSATDLTHATFPGFTYVIVSIQDGKAADLTAWSLAPDRSRFITEAMEQEERKSGRKGEWEKKMRIKDKENQDRRISNL